MIFAKIYRTEMIPFEPDVVYTTGGKSDQRLLSNSTGVFYTFTCLFYSTYRLISPLYFLVYK